jgi:hypothetical protein
MHWCKILRLFQQVCYAVRCFSLPTIPHQRKDIPLPVNRQAGRNQVLPESCSQNDRNAQLAPLEEDTPVDMLAQIMRDALQVNDSRYLETRTTQDSLVERLRSQQLASASIEWDWKLTTGEQSKCTVVNCLELAMLADFPSKLQVCFQRQVDACQFLRL